MRIAICALSAVLLSGCSWLGGINNVFGGQSAQGAYNHGAYNHGQYGASGQARGQNYASANTYGQNFGGGFPQQAQFGQPQHVTGGYGSHAGSVKHANSYGQGPTGPRMRKPKLRGSLSLGVEKSTSGNLLNVGSGVNTGALTEFSFRQSNGFSGSPAEDLTIESDLQAIAQNLISPSISFDDAHSTPARIAGGLEYMMTPKTTLFANAGFSSSEGNEGGAITILGTVIGTPDSATAAEASQRLGVNIVADGVTFTGYRQNVPSGSETIRREVPNLPIAQIAFDFSDMERYDFEVGARHYFNPILGHKITRSLTPFVSASVGAAHYNGLDFKAQRQDLNLHQAVAVAEADQNIVFQPVLNDDTPIAIYDSQWVALGQLNAGLEWQATPKTAIAFETGVKFESARDYTNGTNGDSNVSIPFTIRGSYNF